MKRRWEFFEKANSSHYRVMDLAKDENSSSDDYESEGDNDDRTLFAANIPYSQVSKHFLLICFYKSLPIVGRIYPKFSKK